MNLKVSAFYLEKQKSFISKKNFFWAVVNIKTKKLCLLTQFYGRFWYILDVKKVFEYGGFEYPRISSIFSYQNFQD